MLTDHNKGETEMEMIRETTYTVYGVYGKRCCFNSQIHGTITAYVADKGFGFISQGTTPRDYKRFWFHITSFAGNNGTKPEVGTQVTFSVKPVQEGPNKTAIDVWPL